MNFYIADTHFGHSAVLRFDHRPFTDVQEMENVIVMNWNAAVQKNDTVYILGDFCWGKAEEWIRILKRLNGTKVLIEGNHDLSSYPAELKKQFADIKPYKEIDDNGRKVILSHYPLMFYKHGNDPSYYMLCGHVHVTEENNILEKWTAELRNRPKDGGTHVANCGQIYNVGCMMPWMAYTPRKLNEIIRNWAAYHQEV